MDCDFIIPLKKEDLLTGGEDCYSINRIEFRDAANKVRDLRYSIERGGCDTIAEHFEVCFSFIYDSEEFALSQLQEFYDEVIEEYLKRLIEYTEIALCQDPNVKKRAVNNIKMLFYLFSLTLKTYEDKLTQQNDNLISDPKKNRLTKQRNKNKLEDTWPWNEKKLASLSIIYSFLKQPLSNLWQNLIVEESLINLMAGCCFKTFENTEINLVKNKPLKDSASQVLSLLVVNYNYTLTFLPKSVEVMRQHEHSASAIANTVLTIVREYNCNSILEKLLEEILQVTLEDSQTLGKSAATFISDIGEHNPEHFLSCVDLLKEFIAVDAYFVRNAVMITFCEMIINCFSAEKITAESNSVSTRNSILKELQTQIHDDNAFVRSKVVQLWTKLATASCIPVNFFVPLLRDIGHRLLDKSTNVSKNAIHFYTAALEYNPYGGKLRLKELNKEKEIELSKLKQLMDKQPLPPEERWALMEIQITHSISEYFKQKLNSNGFQDQQNTSGVEVADIIFIIANLINQNLFTEALSLLKSTEAVFPESREIRCNLDKTDEVAYYVASLKKIYLRAAELNPQSIVPDYYENINKMDSTRTVVKYLSDCTDFVEYINKGADTIYKLMFSINNSEILESIEFFSKAYKFQIGNSEKAVRDMLLLVNSNTFELKSVVAKAYASLYLETSKTDVRARAAQIAQRLINLIKGLDHDQKLALEEVLQQWITSEQLDKEFISSLFERVVQMSQGKSSTTDGNAALVLIDIVAGVHNSVVSGNISYLKDLLDPKFDNYTIKTVCCILQKLGAVKKNKKLIRFKQDNEIFQSAVNTLIEKFSSPNEPEYINMAMSVIDLIFQLCYKPEKLGNDILSKMYKKMIEESSAKPEDERKEVLEHLLERLFFVSGHTIFRKWQYCERDVFNCLKRCQDGIVLEKKPDEAEDDFEMEADNEVVADEALYEEITNICETFLTEEDNIVHHIGSLIVAVCTSPDEKVCQALKASAALTLAKFMFISHTFCDQQFPIYITMMDRSKYDSVRSNLVLGFGDLFTRFPNTAKPWTEYLYSRLKDHSELVRLNTVSVLCHLISCEMIKARGQIAELFLHLEDPHPIIAEKVNSLLLDLSVKGNTVYNLIPDIISQLSNPNREDLVAPSMFKLIIGRLFELITKERQSDALVDKLCSRLRESINERQWEDLIYCLSQIHFTKDGLRTLTEALPTFHERLHHPIVHDTLLSIINTCMKSTKIPLKETAQEAMEKLEELMTAKEDNSSTSPKKTPTSESGSTKKSDNEENTNEKELETPMKPITVRETRRTAKKAPKTPRTTKKQPPSHQTVARSTRKKKTVRYNSSSDEG